MQNDKLNFKIAFYFFAIVFSFSFLVFPLIAQAQEVNNLMENLIIPTPLIRADLISIIFKVIQYVLGFLGVVAVVILIYGGFVWMTARGNDEQVKKAKKIIINGLIGLVVVLLSYAIVSFAIGKVQEIGQPPGQVCLPGECCRPCRECSVSGNACDVYNANCQPCGGGGGNFVVRWTYPRDQQENISICALLQAGFNDELDETTVNETNIKITIRDALKGNGGACQENKECKSGKCENNLCLGNTVAGTFTVSRDVFKFNNEKDFEKETWYKFLITTGVKSIGGRNLAAPRSIEFKTGSEADTTPPTVMQVYPPNNEENVCLLEPIQAVFSEPMDATTLLNLESLRTDPLHEFNHSVPNPETLNATPKTSYQKFTQYSATLNSDIIADVCGNKLDGNENGQAEGSPIDDYSWSFKTGDTLRCEPVIDNIAPSSGYYNDELTINGNYFRLAGEIVFNRSVYPNDFCFDNNKFPNQTCLVNWSNRQIKIKVPAAGGASQGAVSGPVYVVVGETPSNSKYFSLNSPYLQSFAPSYGGRGQAITLRGSNFAKYLRGSSKVYFINQATQRRTEGDLICGEAGWKDGEIVVAVPQFIDLRNHYLQVQTKDGKYSNVRLDETFEITGQESGPILCEITPACPGTNLSGGKPSDTKTFSGRRFGALQGEVIFNSTRSQIISWADDKIEIRVPEISPATYQARVVLPNFQESNSLIFISPCFEQGGLRSPCFLNEQTCTIEKCLNPYECKSSSNGLLECRCCCSEPKGCPNPNLECDETQTCYQNKTCANFKNEQDCHQQRGCHWQVDTCESIEITGICCGCNEQNPCAENEICKEKTPGKNCCYACEIGDDGQPCVGGQCCSRSCQGLNQDECLKLEGCSWNNLVCTGSHSPYCCAGRCVDHQCLSLCGNGQIDRQKGEVCDKGDPEQGIPENLDGKTCQDFGFEGGELHCNSNNECKSFDTNLCTGSPGSGYWGEKCQLNNYLGCESGKKDCLNALGADCVQNIETACACCCRPDYPACQEITNQPDCEKDFRCQWQDGSCQSKGDSCDLINPKLSCDISQACGESGQKGLCCGCTIDEDCNNGQGFACKKGCCYQFPPPKELKVISAEQDEIRLNWRYEDKNQLATHFEAWKKDPGETEFTVLTTCEIDDPYRCNPDSGKFILKNPSANLYEFEDKRGNFEKGKEYSYKIRAKKGSQTAYSQFTEPASGKVVGIVSCNLNTDCPDKAPCCRTDTKVCVDWENCQGNCVIGDKCQAPAIKFATHDFWVTEGENGPCLIKVTPNRGYTCEPDFANNVDLVVLSGINFKQRGVNDGVFFNGKIGVPFGEEKEACSGCDGCNYQSWQDKEIKIQYTPAAEAQTGLVKVKKLVAGRELWSNGRTFTVLSRVVGPGSACLKDLDGCRRGGGVCNPAEVYPCTECDCTQYNQTECSAHFPYCEWRDSSCQNIICENITNENICRSLSNPPASYCEWKPWKKCITNKAHCRCCCDPRLRGPNDPCQILPGNLECYPNQDPCTGANRGLCCGCQKDSDCNLSGNTNGCGVGNPRCCYPRPILENLSFCDNIGSPDVRLNTAVTLNFDQKMDFGSLNKDNLKVSRVGSCTSIQEGETIGEGPRTPRCYLYGSITNKNEGDQTQTIFSPKLCRLKPNTIYKVEIVVGENGQGVKSEKGVAMNYAEGKCSWEETKDCQNEEFTTAAQENALCAVQWIDVQSRLQIARDLNLAFNYYGYARDEKNKDVCVESFDWRSDNSGVATVVPHPDDPKIGIATSKGIGTAKIIAQLPAINKTCNTRDHTCGLLRVSLAGPQVVEQQGCETCDLGGQSPSPWKFSEDACLGAQIVARFNRVMNQLTLNNNNIKVRQCLGDEFPDSQCDQGSDISGIITKHERGFYFKPDNQLLPDKIYRVTLISGRSGIKDTNGLELDGNKNGVFDGSPDDDYLWYFKTASTPECPLNKVCIVPGSAKITHPNSYDFSGEIYTQNCNHLKASDYNWQWHSLNENIATVNPVSGPPRTTASSVNLGQTKIKAETAGKEDLAPLIIATIPKIEERYPAGSGLCRNIAIYALFDQEMDENSIKNNFKIEKEPEVPGPLENVTSQFSLRFEKDNQRTKVYFVPNNFLDANKTYTVTLLDEVMSKAPYLEKMGKVEKWSFTTGDYICRLERVEVEPEYHLFSKVKDKTTLVAKAMYQKMEIQPVPALYEWEWSWRSTDSRVVTITNSNNPQQEAESQSQNGIVSIIAKAKITVDKIFKPATTGQFKEGGARVEVWLCENPWPSTKFPEGETYDDTTTNFSFRYCRDAGSPGLVGDLPILKGGKITGPVEPGVEKLTEHFFTVYDGSLSFWYDGTIVGMVKPPQDLVINKSGYNNSLYNLFGDNNAFVSGSGIRSDSNGKFGNALSFAGDPNSYLIVNASGVPAGRNLTIEAAKFTLETWLNMEKPLMSQYIFRKGENEGYGLEIREDGKVYFWVFDQEKKKAEASAVLFANGEPPEGIIPREWAHLAASYDGRNLKIYINGEVKGTATTLNSGIAQSDSNLLIGRDFKGLLDEIALWQKALSAEEIEAHLKKPISPTLGNVLGFKVFTNFEHLPPAEWYKKYAPGIEAGGASAITDGYKSYQVGRTLYVGATNVDYSTSFPKIYTNTHLISQSDNPKPETSQVFKQSINNWKFNINIPDPEPTTPQNESKEKIAHDLERIYHLKTVWQTLENYREINTKEPDLYPKLESGSYIKGMSTSKWPSWTSQTGLGQDLVRAGLSPLPTDPINKFEIKDGCGTAPTQYACCANCPRRSPDCSQTCYNPQESTYECYQSADGKKNSQIYQYMAEGNPAGKVYGLYANFEFYYPDAWQHKCEGLAEADCQARAFCYWEWGGAQSYRGDKFIIAAEPGQPGECKRKVLNYVGNPCSDLNMSCACFNTRFSSVITEPPPLPPQITFNASRYWVYEGESTTLSWSVSGALECNASSQPSHADWQGSVSPAGGSRAIVLNSSTLFTLNCSGLGGQGQAQIQVDVLLPTFTLNVFPSGTTGAGYVLSNPSGIDCGINDPGRPDCSEDYLADTSITLTATAVPPHQFSNWSGACSGTNPTCQLTMNANKNATAVFISPNYNLNVSLAGNGSGLVTSNEQPPLISCQPDCNEQYEMGKEIALTAAPAENSVFAGWSGACSGTNPTCQIKMDSDKSAAAIFNLQLILPQVSTGSATNISSNEATLNGQLTNLGGTESVDVRFKYGLAVCQNQEPDINCPNSTSWQRMSAIGSFSALIFNLNPGVTYHFQAVAKNTNGTAYGNDKTFGTTAYSGYAYVANAGNHNVLRININNLGVSIISLPGGSNDTPRAACITPDKRYVFVTSGKSGYEKIYKIDTATNTVVGSTSTCNHPDSCVVTADGNYVIVGCNDFTDGGVVKLTSGLTWIYTWHQDNQGRLIKSPKDTAISPDGQYAYLPLAGGDMDLARIKLNDHSNNGVTLYDLDNVGFSSPDGIAPTRDGKYLYLSQSSGDKIGVWEISNNTVNYRRTVSVCDSPDRAMAVTPNNQYLFIGCPGSGSNNVGRYTISGDNLINQSFCGNIDDAQYDLAATPDNQYVIILSSSDDRIYRYSIPNWTYCSPSIITTSVDNPQGVCIK